MKRAGLNLGIGLYLLALAWGILSHTLSFQQTAHPVMYYFVWDMYTGWSPFESKMQILGRGESGQYYQLSPPPWGGSVPWGSYDRNSYDAEFLRSWKFAGNTLRHTDHEPMQRIYVVEECWPKQFNLRDSFWDQRFGTPKDRRDYFNVVRVYSPTGEIEAEQVPWRSRLLAQAIMSNPRLAAESRSGTQLFQFEGSAPKRKGSENFESSLQPLAH